MEKEQSNSNIILTITGYFAGLFIVFDVIGAIVISFKYLFWLSNKSMLFLAYPVWIVVAIFNGAFYNDLSQEKLKNSSDLKNKSWIVSLISIVCSILFLTFFEHFDQMISNQTDEYWVPGNLSLTITYFVTLCLSVFFFEKNKINKH